MRLLIQVLVCTAALQLVTAGVVEDIDNHVSAIIDNFVTGKGDDSMGAMLGNVAGFEKYKHLIPGDLPPRQEQEYGAKAAPEYTGAADATSSYDDPTVTDIPQNDEEALEYLQKLIATDPQEAAKLLGVSVEELAQYGGFEGAGQADSNTNTDTETDYSKYTGEAQDEGLTSFSFEVTGLVQGVWFRASTQKEAKQLAITGWVANSSRGSVVGVAEGQAEDLQEFRIWLCEVGSPESQIKACQIKDQHRIENRQYTSFKIDRQYDDSAKRTSHEDL